MTPEDRLKELARLLTDWLGQSQEDEQFELEWDGLTWEEAEVAGPHLARISADFFEPLLEYQRRLLQPWSNPDHDIRADLREPRHTRREWMERAEKAEQRVTELEAALGKIADGQREAIERGEVTWTGVGAWCAKVARAALEEETR